jgi:hypothetical protein
VSSGAVRLGVGARLVYDGEAVEIVEFVATVAGNEVVLKDGRGAGVSERLCGGDR